MAILFSTHPAHAQAPDRALADALGRIYRLQQYTAFDCARPAIGNRPKRG